MFKQRVNQVLTAVTGYHLSRSDAPAPKPGPRGGRKSVAQKPAAQKPAAQKPKEPPAQASTPPAALAAQKQKPGGPPKLPSHYDKAAQAVIRRVRPRTMTGHEKLHGLILATRYVVAHNIPGAIVECGVWRGGSMQAVALCLAEMGETQRDLHLFDTYEGMPPPSEKDRRHDGASAKDLLETQDRSRPVWAIAALDDVQAGMAEVDYPSDHVHFHVGLVEETIPDQAPKQIAILRLDTDWYESTLHELRALYDRLSPGGILIIDDYGHWEGARQAVEDFLAESGAALLLLPLATGRIAVKPGLVPEKSPA